MLSHVHWPSASLTRICGVSCPSVSSQILLMFQSFLWLVVTPVGASLEWLAPLHRSSRVSSSGKAPSQTLEQEHFLSSACWIWSYFGTAFLVVYCAALKASISLSSSWEWALVFLCRFALTYLCNFSIPCYFSIPQIKTPRKGKSPFKRHLFIYIYLFIGTEKLTTVPWSTCAD